MKNIQWKIVASFVTAVVGFAYAAFGLALPQGLDVWIREGIGILFGAGASVYAFHSAMKGTGASVVTEETCLDHIDAIQRIEANDGDIDGLNISNSLSDHHLKKIAKVRAPEVTL